MASNFKSLHPFDRNWIVEVISTGPSNLEDLLEKEASEAEATRKVKFPEVIGILPVRNAVAYPGTVTPLAVGRDRSKNLLEATTPNDSIIGLLTQRNADTENPSFGQLYTVGTAASVLKVIKMPQGSVHVVVHSISRFRVIEAVATEPYLKARVEIIEPKIRRSKKLDALVYNVRQAANRVIELSPNVPEEAAVLLENIDNPSMLADFMAANLNLPIPQKQGLLEELDVAKRLEKISVALGNQLDVLELSDKIQGRVREAVDKSQREYFLQEQLKAIQSELGIADKASEEIRELQKSIKQKDA